MKNYYIYIITNKPKGILYIGMTNNLVRRGYEHRNGLIDGFTKKYNLKRLVYFEVFNHVEAAILREKRLKKWNRQWKIDLIEKDNPIWDDLYEKFVKEDQEIPTFVGMTAFVGMTKECHSQLDRESYSKRCKANKRKIDNNYLHTSYCQLHNS
jgi:putative endonuclease